MSFLALHLRNNQHIIHYSTAQEVYFTFNTISVFDKSEIDDKMTTSNNNNDILITLIIVWFAKLCPLELFFFITALFIDYISQKNILNTEY